MRYFASLLLCALLSFADEPAKSVKPDKIVSITAERFAFSPSKVKLKQGMVVEFVITSDDTDHGFRIPGANIDAAIPQHHFKAPVMALPRSERAGNDWRFSSLANRC